MSIGHDAPSGTVSVVSQMQNLSIEEVKQYAAHKAAEASAAYDCVMQMMAGGKSRYATRAFDHNWRLMFLQYSALHW